MNWSKTPTLKQGRGVPGVGRASAWVLLGPGVADASSGHCRGCSLGPWDSPQAGMLASPRAWGQLSQAPVSEAVLHSAVCRAAVCGVQSQTRLSDRTADEKSLPVSETHAFTGVLHEDKRSL